MLPLFLVCFLFCFFVCLFFNSILFILAGNKDMHQISDDFEIRPDPTTDSGVSYTCASEISP